MIALDASVLIAHSEPEDAHHGRAGRLLDELATHDFVLHPVNAAEVLVNPVRTGADAIARADWAAMGVEVVAFGADGPSRLARLRVSTGLKLPDCCVLETAQRFTAAVATFDDRLARAARDLGLDVVGAESPGGA